MKIPRRLTDKNLGKNPDLKKNVLSFLLKSINFIADINQKYNIYPEEKKEKKIVIENEITVLKEQFIINVESNKWGLNNGIINLQKMRDFKRKKEIIALKDSYGLAVLIEEKIKTLQELSIEEKNFEDTVNFIRNTVIEYHSSSVFSKLLEDLGNETVDEGLKVEIVGVFIYLLDMNLVLETNIVSFDKETTIIFNLLEKEIGASLTEKICYYLLMFYYKSYDLNIFSNFKIHKKTNSSDYEEKLFSIFLSSELPEIKIYISLLFVIFSLISELWKSLKTNCLIKPTTKYLEKYLISSSKCETDIVSNLKNFAFIVRIFSFVCEDRNFYQIFHVEFFKNYLNVILILFKINHPSLINDVLKILIKFSYFSDCKIKILEDKNLLIVNKAKDRIYNLCHEFYNLKEAFIESSDKIIRIKSLLERSELPVNYKIKYEEDLEWFEKVSKDSKFSFLSTVNFIEEFGHLISFLNSLVLVNDYEDYYEKVFKLKGDNIQIDKLNFGRLYRILEKCDEIFKNNNITEKIFDLESEDNELNNMKKNYEKIIAYISKFLYQLIILRITRQPTIRIQDYPYKNTDVKCTGDYMYYFDNIIYYLNDQDALHKLLFALNRFFTILDRNEAFHYEDSKEELKNFIERISFIIYSESASVFVNREGLRLLCTLSKFADQASLWCKFDPFKLPLDYSNISDLLLISTIFKPNFQLFLKKRNSEIIKEYDQYKIKNNENIENGLLIYPPYKKVLPYLNKYGAIFFTSHVLVIPKTIHLENNFTICFRFFNPLVNTGNFHTLIQSENGISLIAVTNDRKRLGCFTTEGEWIESEIELDNEYIFREWIQITITYRGEYYDEEDEVIKEDQLCFYLEASLVGSPYTGKFKFPNNIKYIGNSKKMDEPFGLICDLRVYNQYCNDRVVKELYEPNNSNDIPFYFPQNMVRNLISNYLLTHDNTEESFHLTIKLFNNLLSDYIYRQNTPLNNDNEYEEDNEINISLNSYKIIEKITNHFSSISMETKIEISKFLTIIG